MEKNRRLRALDTLVSALEDSDPEIRVTAAQTLGSIGDDRTVEPLIAALKDRDRRVRRKVAEALGGIRNKRAVEPLVKALKDEDRKTRNTAAKALGLIGDKRAAGPITAFLKNGNRNGNPAWSRIAGARGERSSRRAAVKALARIDPMLMKKNGECVAWYPDLFCSECYRRAIRIEIQGYLFGKMAFVVCPECYVPTHLLTGITHVAGVIGGKIGRPQIDGSTLMVPVWNEWKKMPRFADIDSLLILDGVANHLLAINAVILCFSDGPRKEGWMKKITVHIKGDTDLSAAAIGMLGDNFNRVTP